MKWRPTSLESTYELSTLVIFMMKKENSDPFFIVEVNLMPPPSVYLSLLRAKLIWLLMSRPNPYPVEFSLIY